MNGEGGTATCLALNQNFPTMAFDDVIGDCQAHAGAAPHGTRREKWFEYSVKMPGGNAMTGVGNRNFDHSLGYLAG